MAESVSIPGYNILRELGRGGMANVYLATQQSFEREVALKVMSPQLNADPSFATRFMREARIVAHIHHSSIVPVFDVGHTDPYHYMSMEFLPAGDLKERIVGGAFGPRLAYGVCLTIASALELAHRKGFVHRDIKPENILFREDGTAVLTDFGIARAIDAGTSLTVAGTFVGTPSYMSPEQVKGLELDGRSDLYSLGIVFYEMLTGDVPFHADSGFSIAMKQLADPLPQLPPALTPYQAFLDRMTAKDPAARFATGAEVIQALREIGEINVTREEISLGKTQVPHEGTLLRPANPSRPEVSARQAPELEPELEPEPKQRPNRAGFNWRSAQAIWLSGGLVVLLAIVVVSVLPEKPAVVEAAPPVVIGEPLPAPIAEQSEAERRAEVAAAAQRATEVKMQQEFERLALEERIRPLLLAAKEQIAAGALFTPVGANAIESYRAALKLQPKQPEASVGLKRISEILVAEAVQSKSIGDRDGLKRYVDLVQAIQPQHSLLAHLRRELKRLETKPMVLHPSTQANLEKTAKMVARANADLNRKSVGFGEVESASEQYDKAAELAPFTPGLPTLKERIIAAYAKIAQHELNDNEPKRAMKVLNFARERKWFSPDLEQIEALVKQQAGSSTAAPNAGGPRR